LVAISRRVALAATAVLAGGMLVVVAPTGASANGIPANGSSVGGSARAYPLPSGDRVLVHGSGAHAGYSVLDAKGRPVPAVKYDVGAGHAYVIPLAALAAGRPPIDMSKYDIPTLSSAAPAAAAGPNGAVAHYVMGILQVNATDLTGSTTTASGSVFLVNTDSVTRWSTPMAIASGVARVAVPTGHYAAYTTFYETNPTTGVVTTYLVATQDFTVAPSVTTQLNVNERAATVPVTVATPKPATADMAQVNLTRGDAAGLTGSVNLFGGGPIYVSPAPAAKVGSFAEQVDWAGVGPAGTSDQYRYDLMFPSANHIDAKQVFSVAQSQLATNRDVFDIDPAVASGDSGTYEVGPVSAAASAIEDSESVPTPGTLTDYLSAPLPGYSWGQGYFYASLPTNPVYGSVSLDTSNPATAYPVGKTVTRTWGQGPLTPQVGQFKGALPCNACVDGTTMDLGLSPLDDTNPDSSGSIGGAVTGSLTVYRDGTQVASVPNAAKTELTGITQQAGTYRMVLDQDLSAFGFTQSTSTHTDLSFRYQPTGNPTLPSGDTCSAQGTSTTRCQILPLLNLSYALQGTDGLNTSHSAVQTLDLTVGHQSYNGTGSTAAITGATVSVSYDAGKTWVAATAVSTGGGHYKATWPNNAAKGTTPWLKVTATDAVAGSISQTVANAYTIGSLS